ncbi:MAG: Heimdall-CTERM domain-containing surface protein, partial [Candidatus Hodarchaeales archaeon]
PTSGFEFLSLLAMMVTITILNLHRRRKRIG